MDKKFVGYLCCPETGQSLLLEADELFAGGMVKSGRLVTADGAKKYPIINGIPRFVKEELYSSSFGFEWSKWPRVQFESENVGGPMAGQTTRMFDSITGFGQEDLNDKLAVEFGCGPGRFLDVVRRRGGLAIGIDMSLAVESARKNFADDADVLVVQGDILNPPFKKNVFDFGYTIGVLHHTPDPETGFQKLLGTVKSGGRVAVCVYEKGRFYDYPSVYAYRKLYNFIGTYLSRRLVTGLAIVYSYFAANFLYHIFAFLRKLTIIGKGVVYVLQKYLLPNVHIPDRRWRFLDVFDAITPYNASAHTSKEVSDWLEHSQCMGITRTPWCGTSYVGHKK